MSKAKSYFLALKIDNGKTLMIKDKLTTFEIYMLLIIADFLYNSKDL